MRRITLLMMVLLSSLHPLSGCSDSSSPNQNADFQGDWVAVSNVAEKLSCEVGPLNEIQIHDLRIDQDGQVAALDLEGLELVGSVQDELLLASGNSETGEELQLSLTRIGSALHGDLQISGSCTQSRALTARRRGADSDFSGHWAFDLTVVGVGGCEHISDYSDCFRIFQNSNELLVVDDVGGNLIGRVIGHVARIERDTPEEQTTLVFYMDEASETLSGEALRAFGLLECRTSLEFVARRSDVPCAEHEG